MTIESLTTFFMWCFIINTGILLFWSFFILIMPDFVYRIQSKFISIPRQQFDIVMYSFIALFKALTIVFCLVPWLALLIMG